MILEMVTDSKEKALSIAMIDIHWQVLHAVAFHEGPAKSDIPTTEESGEVECDGECVFCPDEYCPAKDVDDEEEDNSSVL
jgi:hypothetical protein